MSDAWQSITITVGDTLFGGLLSLPRDLAVVLLGVLLGVAMLAIRLATTDRARLRQIAADERRLRELIRTARAAGDRQALARIRRTRRLVAGQRASAEWLSIVASLVVLCAIVPWGRRRLEYLPLRGGEPIRFVVRTPASLVGEAVHVVPQEGLADERGWVRSIAAAVESGSPVVRAEWSLRADPADTPYVITVRLRNQSVAHSLFVGTSTYETPIQSHDGGIETEALLTPYRVLGFVPPRVLPGLPGWGLVLALVTGGIFFGGRRLLRL
jgi:hypothetical protein